MGGLSRGEWAQSVYSNLSDYQAQQPRQIHRLRNIDNGPPQVFRPDGDALDLGSPQVRSTESGFAEIRATKHGVGENRAFEIGTPEIGIPQVARLKLRAAEPPIAELRIPQIAVFDQDIFPVTFDGSHSGHSAVDELDSNGFKSMQNSVGQIALDQPNIPQPEFGDPRTRKGDMI